MNARYAQSGRLAVLGAALAGGAAAVAGGVQLSDQSAAKDADFEVCIRADAAMIEGLSPGCYDKKQLKAYRDKLVLGLDGAPVAVALAHPKDDLAPLEIVKTCHAYSEKMDRRWFALSNREMRRQSYFVRACGALEMLIAAEKPERSFFKNGELTRADLKSLAGGPPFRMAERAETAAVETEIETVKTGGWRLKMSDQAATIIEIAHADFDRDGVGDILAFASIGVTGGTARIAEIGLLQKSSETAPVRFTPSRAEKTSTEG